MNEVPKGMDIPESHVLGDWEPQGHVPVFADAWEDDELTAALVEWDIRISDELGWWWGPGATDVMTLN